MRSAQRAVSTPPMRQCPECGHQTALYDTWEDAYLCQHADCQAILYPDDFNEPRNPDAGIWHIGKKAQ